MYFCLFVFVLLVRFSCLLEGLAKILWLEESKGSHGNCMDSWLCAGQSLPVHFLNHILNSVLGFLCHEHEAVFI